MLRGSTAGLRSRPADTDESDRDHERPRHFTPFMISIRSVGVRRYATPSNRSSPFFSVTQFLRL